MEALLQALRRGALPPDLQAKLAGLRATDAKENYLRQSSLLLARLLMAAHTEGFCHARPGDCERLLRMLAYVRKDEDAIPDSWPGGFEDDHDLMRWVCGELRPVLEAYKAWHLVHRVPRLWSSVLPGAGSVSSGAQARGY